MSQSPNRYVRLTTAQALVRHLVAQRIVIEGRERRCSAASSPFSATAM